MNEQKTAALMALADDYAREKQYEEDKPMAPHIDVHAARERLAIALCQALVPPDAALIGEGDKPVQKIYGYEFETLVDDGMGLVWEKQFSRTSPIESATRNVIPLYATPQPAPKAEIPASVPRNDDHS